MMLINNHKLCQIHKTAVNMQLWIMFCCCCCFCLFVDFFFTIVPLTLFPFVNTANLDKMLAWITYDLSTSLTFLFFFFFFKLFAFPHHFISLCSFEILGVPSMFDLILSHLLCQHLALVTFPRCEMLNHKLHFTYLAELAWRLQAGHTVCQLSVYQGSSSFFAAKDTFKCKINSIDPLSIHSI